MTDPAPAAIGRTDFPADALKIVLESTVPVVIADAALKDMPLIAVNDAFCSMSGYAVSDMIGWNCRFMQPAEGIGPAKERMRSFLGDAAAMQSTFVIPNARKNGSRFLNLLHLAKVTRADRAPFIIGSQFDVTTQTTDALARYCDRFTADYVAIASICTAHGWTMEQPDISLSQDLRRIADYQDLMGL